MNIFLKTLIIACSFAFVFGQSAALAADKEKVRIVYVEWPCAVSTVNIAKVVIEERLGHPVELIPVSVAVMFQALGKQEAEASVSVWLPDTQATYMEKLKGQVVDLGPLVSGAKLGWVVPDYVPMTSIEQLKGHAKEFKGKIYGIDAGSVYMGNSEDAIEGYGLDGFSLETSSDAVMVAMLADAIRKQEWVAVTGWSPHWMFGKWKLHFLEDPKGYFGKEESIHTVVRNNLDKDMPEVFAFLDKFSYLDTAQLQTLMAQNEEKGADPLENAKKFVRENKDQVDSWLK